MTDYDKMKDIFEMAEILENFGGKSLTISVVQPDKLVFQVKFLFNRDLELVEAITEEG